MRKILSFIFTIAIHISACAQSDRIENRKDYAMVVGISNYTEWTDIDKSVQSATAIGDLLRSRYGFEVDIIEDASNEGILNGLYRFYSMEFGPFDQLLVYISGHGAINQRSKQGFVIPNDGKLNDPIGSSYFSFSNLRDALDGIPCKHIMLILDVDYARKFDMDIARSGKSYGRSVDSLQSAPKEEREYIEWKLEKKSRVYIAYEGDKYDRKQNFEKHTPLSNWILQVLSADGDGTGIIDISNLESSIKNQEINPVIGEFGSYEPMSDFLFIAK